MQNTKNYAPERDSCDRNADTEMKAKANVCFFVLQTETKRNFDQTKTTQFGQFRSTEANQNNKI